jgi:hypothetical protein
MSLNIHDQVKLQQIHDQAMERSACITAQLETLQKHIAEMVAELGSVLTVAREASKALLPTDCEHSCYYCERRQPLSSLEVVDIHNQAIPWVLACRDTEACDSFSRSNSRYLSGTT